MEDLKISIVIVNWNVKDYILQCLESIYYNKQTWKEIIVVDNASFDDSVSSIREQFPLVNLIQLKENVGFTKAINLAITLCKGKYIFLLNPDTIVQTMGIERLIHFMESTPSCGIGCPLFLNPDGTVQFAGGRFRSLKSIVPILFLNHDPDIFLQPLSEKPYRIEKPYGAAMLIRNKVFEQIGIFDEELWYSEEDDLACRAIKAKWEVWLIPGAAITHYGGQSSKQNVAIATANQHIGKLIFFKRHRSKLNFNVLVLIVIISLLLKYAYRIIIYVLLPESSKEKIKGYHLALRAIMNGEFKCVSN